MLDNRETSTTGSIPEDRHSINEENLCALLHIPSADQGKIRYKMSSQMLFVAKDLCIAKDQDPFFLLEIPDGMEQLFISVQIYSPRKEGQVIVYYSCEKDAVFSENNRIILGKTDGTHHVHHLSFPAPVYWIRLDPIDGAENFSILHLEISGSQQIIDDAVIKSVGSTYLLPMTAQWALLRKQLQEKALDPWRTVVFVTHELSGTGAPLLCRKISASAKAAGMQTVIISLPGQGKAEEETILLFSQACDVLLICRNEEDVSRSAAELHDLGINRIVLNSIMSGRAVEVFHNADFRIACLIHEMRCSCEILHAEEWIHLLASLAGYLIFPAQCVLDDFMSFDVKIKGNTLIMPQGFYKNVDRTVMTSQSGSARESILQRLQLTEDANLFIGVGSINYGKGTDLLPLIAKELQQISDGNDHFLWLGASNDERYEIWLKSQIEKMGLTDHFHFLGYVSDDAEYMNIVMGCSALTLVSREDSYPSIMIEAMSCGVPVVAFIESGGAQELLSNGRGYLVDYMDIKAYAQVLKSIIIEPEKAKKVADKAYEHFAAGMKFDEYVNSIMDTFKLDEDEAK